MQEPDVENFLISGKRQWFSENATDRLGECHAARSHRLYLYIYYNRDYETMSARVCMCACVGVVCAFVYLRACECDK